MTVAEPAAARPTPPPPEECDHPRPVRGVMAHEFSPYRDALGPEGTRRTTMHYGPVVGGLPIQAWHCETCGQLRLEYPDGRREERRLFPGPQPGLLARPLAGVLAPEAVRGTQARVSGLTLPAELAADLVPAPPPFAAGLRAIDLPDWGLTVWLTVLLLVAGSGGLVVLGVGAFATSATPDWLGGAGVVVAIPFGLALVTPIVSATFLHFFPWPRLGASPASALRGRPQLDGVTVLLVTMLSLLIGGLVAVGVLAIYDWKTPDLVAPLTDALLALFGLALVVGVAGAAARRSHRG